jgi:hypothetical protein
MGSKLERGLNMGEQQAPESGEVVDPQVPEDPGMPMPSPEESPEGEDGNGDEDNPEDEAAS